MYFYEVAPRSRSYQSLAPLVYESEDSLPPGQVVEIDLRHSLVTGLIIRSVKKPTFKTKEISSTFDIKLPAATVELFIWMSTYYPGPLGILTQHFLPKSIKELSSSKESAPTSAPKKQPALTKDQLAALKTINSYKPPATLLLHGITGSGKTRIYTEMASESLKQGKSAIILTPEIALTPQLAKTFRETFAGDIVEVVHSNLTDSQKRKIWTRVATAKEPKIIIGPRSALFYPLNNVGLIVIDEFHDSSYKQESSPFYFSPRVASVLSQLHRCHLIMGSATPPVSEYFVAESKGVPIVKMDSLAIKNTFNTTDNVRLVDLKNPDEKTKHPLISNTLLSELNKCLDNNNQALVFINKRGSARNILCNKCGWHSVCPKCDLALVYHADAHHLRCHTCGYSEKAPTSCPTCGSEEIIYKSPGTKEIASLLSKLFPDKKVVRFDRDNKKADRIEENHQAVVDGTIDIIVGTQVLTKGHDFPKLGLVTILQAESSLGFPDYTAEEKTYQLIRQLMGRINRGHVRGVLVLQSFDNKNPVIKAAIKNDWDSFYSQQLQERKLFNFPPYTHMLKIECSRSSREAAKKGLDKLAKDIENLNLPVEILGPAPCFIEKRNNKWYWQLILKSKNRKSLLEVTKIPGNYIFNLDPLHLL